MKIFIKYLIENTIASPGFLMLLFVFSMPVSGQEAPGSNVLVKLNKENLGEYSWMNAPKEYSLTEEGLSVKAEQGTDFFINPEDLTAAANAPFLFREVEGDFVAITRVTPNFDSVWNACALMVYLDASNWIKFAFENSDASGPGIVSVVTRGVSDDANGAVLNEYEALWLKLVRKGNIYALHWSADGKDYKMARLSAMPDQKTVKVGIEAQCPSQGPAVHLFTFFSLENKTVEDLRKGE